MALVELLRHRRFLVAACAGIVVGGVIGLFLPIRAADPPNAEEQAWSLPNAQALKRFRGDQFTAVQSGRFWGDLAMPGRRPAAQKSVWNLRAIVTRPVVQVAVATSGAPGQTWVRLGGALPDGTTLVAVNRDRIWFEKDDCRRVRSLYQDPRKPDPDGCIGAATAGNGATASPRAPGAPLPAPVPSASKPQ